MKINVMHDMIMKTTTQMDKRGLYIYFTNIKYREWYEHTFAIFSPKPGPRAPGGGY